jgi:(1->4)-alpha-D-glucan 1-alpha-D-glucosylmutase
MQPRLPVSTYRLQFNLQFTFRDALRLVPYLHRLGITDVYASPLLQARRGSLHGYDVTDPSHLNPELGTDADFDEFVAELKKHDMGLLLDIVPNHMAASSENPWWMDLLENGPRSQFASHFDVDWHPPSRALEDRVLLPILGRPFAEALESGELRLTFESGSFFINYFDFKLPVNPRTYAQLLEYHADRLPQKANLDPGALQEFQGLLAGLQQLAASPQASDLDRRQVHELKDRLSRLYGRVPEIKRFIDRNLRTFNGKKDVASSFGLLDRLLARQAYVLAFWQTPNQGINYRRFFTISDLVGVRIGDPAAFEASHAVPMRLANKGMVTGFRIDHIDGLRDPEGYLCRLQERARGTNGDNCAVESDSLPFYVVLEKVLSAGELLPRHWPVQGTTGYDYLNAVNGLFADNAGLAALDKPYREFVRSELSYDDLVYLKKKQVMATMLSVEIRSLGHYLGMLALQDRYGREIPRDDLTRALVETTACFPVYRTYLRDFEVPPADRKFIELALAEAQRRNPHLNGAAFAWLRDLLLLEPVDHVQPEQREHRLSFVMTWQQITGPITAKGVEDSALYVYNRLLSLNEVGGNPTLPANSPVEFHKFLAQRHKEWPYTMNATMTHDAKHAEDVRARLNVLTEIPDQWSSTVARWSSWNADKRTQNGSLQVPEPNEEMLLYQALLGSWPACGCANSAYVKRIQDFVVKAGREAMVNTRWTVPNVQHEEALTNFVAAILQPSPQNQFLTDFQEFAATIAFHGALNSLGQLLVKIGSPGVADFYQGSEFWDLRLVDPDNRQPVDFAVRTERLATLSDGDPAGAISDLLGNWQTGVLKLFVAQRALQFRSQHGQLFLNGKYIPLAVRGAHQDSIFAFARHHRRSWALVVVPRLTTRITKAPVMPVGEQAWADTSIVLPASAPEQWRNLLTNTEHGSQITTQSAELRISSVLSDLPVAFLAGPATVR